MAGDSWALIPSVIILEILSYLSQKDRISATSTCKRWRSCLFQPKLWKSLTLNLNKHQRERTNFLSDVCGRFVRECAIRFNPSKVEEVVKSLNVLDSLVGNINIQVLQLQPTSCHFDWANIPDFRYIQKVQEVLRSCRKLIHLSLGCSEDVLAHSSALVETLATNHSHSLQAFHLASVKEDSENYGIVDLNVENFQHFTSLKHLSIDYDFVDSRLLKGFCRKGQYQLERLIIHVHGVGQEQEIISNSSWREFTNYNKHVEVTLNLIHSFSGVEKLVDILKRDLPLTHFRQFFCSMINDAALRLMANQYSYCLKSIEIVDGMENGECNWYNLAEIDEDPFIMLAWKCPRLNKISIIGYEVVDENLVAIARLREDTLDTLAVPECCIHYEEMDSDPNPSETHLRELACRLSHRISKSLGRNWRPLPDDSLPEAIFDEMANAEEVYNHIFLEDQKYIQM